MSRLICVHGIGHQASAGEILLATWLPALRGGLRRAQQKVDLVDSQVAVGFYGDLFRPPGQRLTVGEPVWTVSDVEPGLEQDLLMAWWAEAARVDDHVVSPDGETLVRTPSAVQAGLRALTRSRFFADVALRAMVSDLKQVSRYLTDQQLRDQVRDRVAAVISDETRVVLAHSLGSVVAYEALCASPGHPVRALVTLGSPLGIPNIIFDRLQPPPIFGASKVASPARRGVWPGGARLAWSCRASEYLARGLCRP